MKNRYSIFSLIKNAFSYHENWQKAWRDPQPKKEYEAVIVGGGGHGLATAFYLAKKHNMKNIAVVEKGWIGGGNTGRNTTIIRSNYLWDASAGLYDHALKIWEERGFSNTPLALIHNVNFKILNVLYMVDEKYKKLLNEKKMSENDIKEYAEKYNNVIKEIKIKWSVIKA